MSVRTSLLITVPVLLLLGACATSQKIQVVQPGDNRLECRELTAQIAKLSDSEKEIDSKKGVTGTNVAAALFWLPGLAYTYYDAGQASKLISDRKSHLTALYNNKNCA